MRRCPHVWQGVHDFKEIIKARIFWLLWLLWLFWLLWLLWLLWRRDGIGSGKSEGSVLLLQFYKSPKKTKFPWTSNNLLFRDRVLNLFLGLPPLAMICSTTGVSQYTVRSKSQSVTNKFIVKYTEMVFVPSVLKMFPFGTPGQSFISAYTIMQNHCKCCTLEKSKTLQHGGKVDSVTASFNCLKSVE